MEFEGSWDRHLSLIKFAYNNSYQANIHMAPFEVLHRIKCTSLVRWLESRKNKLFRLELVIDPLEKVKIIKEMLKVTKDR